MKKISVTVGLILLTLMLIAGSSPVWANEQTGGAGRDVAVYPNVFIVFDTSGSSISDTAYVTVEDTVLPNILSYPNNYTYELEHQEIHLTGQFLIIMLTLSIYFLMEVPIPQVVGNREFNFKLI